MPLPRIPPLPDKFRNVNFESDPHWKKIQEMVQEQVARIARQESIITDGFAMAFLDATGIKPDHAQMIVQESSDSSPTGEHKLVRRIWFERRTA